MKEVIRDFKLTISTFIFYFILSLVMIYFTHGNPSTNRYLSASQATPWGVITSLFVYNGLEQFIQDIIGLLCFTILFIFINMYNPKIERREYSLLFLLNVILLPILLNIGWIIKYPYILTAGSSGAVYVSIGMVFCYAFFNILISLIKHDREIDIYFILNLVIFIGIIFSITINPSKFFSANLGTNVLVHIGGFFIGSLITGLYLLKQIYKL